MDTIDLHLTIEKDQSLYFLEEINWIDLYVLNSKENKYRLKIHLPLFFSDTNAYLVQTQEKVDEVFKNLYELLSSIDIIEMKIVRVDYPFTYIMPEENSFYKYNYFFNLLSKISRLESPRFRGAKFITSREEFLKNETFILTDSTNTNSYNNKIIFYNQKKKILDVKGEDYYKKVEKNFPDLPFRMRIEVSKRKKDKLDFENFEVPNLKNIKKAAFEDIRLLFDEIAPLIDLEIEYVLKQLKLINRKKIKSELFLTDIHRGNITNLTSLINSIILFKGEGIPKRTLEDALIKIKIILCNLIKEDEEKIDRSFIRKNIDYFIPEKIREDISRFIYEELKL